MSSRTASVSILDEEAMLGARMGFLIGVSRSGITNLGKFGHSNWNLCYIWKNLGKLLCGFRSVHAILREKPTISHYVTTMSVTRPVRAMSQCAFTPKMAAKRRYGFRISTVGERKKERGTTGWLGVLDD